MWLVVTFTCLMMQNNKKLKSWTMQAIVTKSECRKWKKHESSRWTMQVAKCKGGESKHKLVNGKWNPKALKQKFLNLIKGIKRVRIQIFDWYPLHLFPVGLGMVPSIWIYKSYAYEVGAVPTFWNAQAPRWGWVWKKTTPSGHIHMYSV